MLKTVFAFPLPVTRTGSVTEMFDAFRKDPFVGQTLESVEHQLEGAGYVLTGVTSTNWDSWKKQSRIHTWRAFFDFFHIYHDGTKVVTIEHWEKHRTWSERMMHSLKLRFRRHI